MNKPRSLILFLAVIGLSLVGCAQGETRSSYYQNPENPIVIALAYPFESIDKDTHYLEGINLAVSEINERGGVLLRHLTIIRKDDQSSVNTGSEIAQQLSDDPAIAAVIGHWNSSVSIPASSIYDSNQMLMLSVASTSPKLTKSGYPYVFRGIPNDNAIARNVADSLKQSGLKRLAIVYTDDDYGRGLANAFEQRTTEIGSVVADRVAGVTERDGTDLIRRWKAMDVDALFVAAVMPEAGNIINLVRDNGFELPIYSGTGLDRTTAAGYLGDNRYNVFCATLFDGSSQEADQLRFTESFKHTYQGLLPDSWSLLGYDAVQLIANAMEKAGSPLPQDVASAMHGLKDLDLVTGTLSCGEDGEFTGYTVYMRSLFDGSVSQIK